MFQGKYRKCPHLKNYKSGKQFVLTTLYQFRELIFGKLKAFYEDLLKDGEKNKTIAKIIHRKKYNLFGYFSKCISLKAFI